MLRESSGTKKDGDISVVTTSLEEQSQKYRQIEKQGPHVNSVSV